jgi:hypothetical protein
LKASLEVRLDVAELEPHCHRPCLRALQRGVPAALIGCVTHSLAQMPGSRSRKERINVKTFHVRSGQNQDSKFHEEGFCQQFLALGTVCALIINKRPVFSTIRIPDHIELTPCQHGLTRNSRTRPGTPPVWSRNSAEIAGPLVIALQQRHRPPVYKQVLSTVRRNWAANAP